MNPLLANGCTTNAQDNCAALTECFTGKEDTAAGMMTGTGTTRKRKLYRFEVLFPEGPTTLAEIREAEVH